MNRYCFDVEIFPNFFSVTFVSTDAQRKNVFVIWKERDDKKSLLKFLASISLFDETHVDAQTWHLCEIGIWVGDDIKRVTIVSGPPWL